MRSYLLQARKAYVHPFLFLPCTQSEKDRESECVAWYQFVWRGSRFGRPVPKVALCASRYPAFYQTKQHPPSDRFILSARPRKIPIILAATSSERERVRGVANENRKLNGAVWWPRLMTPLETITLIVFLNIEDKSAFFFFYVGARKSRDSRSLTKFSRTAFARLNHGYLRNA